mgnify:CR=1 FL=1
MWTENDSESQNADKEYRTMHKIKETNQNRGEGAMCIRCQPDDIIGESKARRKMRRRKPRFRKNKKKTTKNLEISGLCGKSDTTNGK